MEARDAWPHRQMRPTTPFASCRRLLTLLPIVAAPVSVRAQDVTTVALKSGWFGAGGGNRTPMTLRSPDFESGASASFTTPAPEAQYTARTDSR